MREYGKVSPKFWIGSTGKALRKHGHHAQLVGLYLITSPHANMLGLFYLPKAFMAHETGLGLEGASKGLQGCIEAGFCRYDEESEMVWVVEMARYQIADSLKDKDLRIKGVQNEYDSIPSNPYLAGFYDLYADAFCMSSKRDDPAILEGASKGLLSQEQEQEQYQEQKQEQKQETIAAASAAAPKKLAEQKDEPNPVNLLTWQAYKQAYTDRYSVPPIRDAATNAKIKSVVKGLGEEAPMVAAFFVFHNDARYVRGMHQIGFLATDYAKLRTEWATNTLMTQATANQTDKTATNLNAFAPLIAAAKAREEAERNQHASQPGN